MYNAVCSSFIAFLPFNFSSKYQKSSCQVQKSLTFLQLSKRRLSFPQVALFNSLLAIFESLKSHVWFYFLLQFCWLACFQFRCHRLEEKWKFLRPKNFPQKAPDVNHFHESRLKKCSLITNDTAAVFVLKIWPRKDALWVSLFVFGCFKSFLGKVYKNRKIWAH